jgi:hypothetical protein
MFIKAYPQWIRSSAAPLLVLSASFVSIPCFVLLSHHSSLFFR